MEARLDPILAQFLVGESILSQADLMRAHEELGQRGGTLDTILLETELLDESKLTLALGLAWQTPLISLHEKPDTFEEAMACIHPQVAFEHGFAPYAKTADGLHILCTAPLDKAVLANFSQIIGGLPVIPHAVPQVRVEQIRSAGYGFEFHERFARLIGRLGHRPPRLAILEEAATSSTHTADTEGWTLQEALNALEQATDRAAIAQVTISFARQFVPFAALFGIKGGKTMGWHRSGDSNGSLFHETPGLLSTDSAFFRLLDKGQPLLETAKQSLIEPALFQWMGRSTPHSVLCIPVCVANRLVGALYLDNQDAPLSGEALVPFLEFGRHIGPAFERILRRPSILPQPASALKPPTPNPSSSASSPVNEGPGEGTLNRNPKDGSSPFAKDFISERTNRNEEEGPDKTAHSGGSHLPAASELASIPAPPPLDDIDTIPPQFAEDRFPNRQHHVISDSMPEQSGLSDISADHSQRRDVPPSVLFPPSEQSTPQESAPIPEPPPLDAVTDFPEFAEFSDSDADMQFPNFESFSESEPSDSFAEIDAKAVAERIGSKDANEDQADEANQSTEQGANTGGSTEHRAAETQTPELAKEAESALLGEPSTDNPPSFAIPPQVIHPNSLTSGGDAAEEEQRTPSTDVEEPTSHLIEEFSEYDIHTDETVVRNQIPAPVTMPPFEVHSDDAGAAEINAEIQTTAQDTTETKEAEPQSQERVPPPTLPPEAASEGASASPTVVAPADDQPHFESDHSSPVDEADGIVYDDLLLESHPSERDIRTQAQEGEPQPPLSEQPSETSPPLAASDTKGEEKDGSPSDATQSAPSEEPDLSETGAEDELSDLRFQSIGHEDDAPPSGATPPPVPDEHQGAASNIEEHAPTLPPPDLPPPEQPTSEADAAPSDKPLLSGSEAGWNDVVLDDAYVGLLADKQADGDDEQDEPPAQQPPEFEDPPKKPPALTDAVEEEISDLIEMLASIDETSRKLAKEAILAHGQEAVSHIKHHFPGPIYTDPFQSAGLVQSAREFGPLLEIFDSLGKDSLDDILVFVKSESPLHRYAVVLLLSAMKDERALSVLVPLLHDEEERIQLLSRNVLEKYLAHPKFESSVLVPLRRNLSSPELQEREFAIQDLGFFRDVGAIPLLLNLLSRDKEQLGDALSESLLQVTFQDFGENVKHWNSWWSHHKSECRMDWLIDGLMAKNREVRLYAQQELVSVAGDDFGYDCDGKASERKSARKTARKWWKEKKQELEMSVF